MAVVLCGANPGVRLLDGDTVTAFASVWVVDWSVRGSGTALVLWHDGRVRALGGDPSLAEWLATGLTAHGGDIAVTMSGVLDRRLFDTDDFALGGVSHELRLLVAPVSTAAITVGGRRLPGSVTVGGTAKRPSSSAFLATAEVWSV